MAVYYHIDGVLTLKEGMEDVFADMFDDLLDTYDPFHTSKLTDDGRYMFQGFARWPSIDDTQRMMADNIDKIKEGQVWFTCNDESSAEGFDFMIFREVCNGVIHQSALTSRLPCEWGVKHADDDWWMEPTRRERRNKDTQVMEKEL